MLSLTVCYYYFDAFDVYVTTFNVSVSNLVSSIMPVRFDTEQNVKLLKYVCACVCVCMC